MIPIVNVGYASTNYYVLGSSTARLLIDVGWPAMLAEIEQMDNAIKAGVPATWPGARAGQVLAVEAPAPSAGWP